MPRTNLPVEWMVFGKHKRNARKLFTSYFGKNYRDIIRNEYLDISVGQRKILDTIAADGNAIKDEFLNAYYQQYLVQNKKFLSPRQWLLDGRRAEPVKNYLTALFGKDYKKSILRAYETKIIASAGPLPTSVVNVYDRILKLGRAEYSKIESIKNTLTPAEREIFNNLFEIDHVIEQRFFNIFGNDEFSAFSQLQCFLVPKHRAAAMMLLKAPGSNAKTIAYTHYAKTQWLRKLIPHGAEHLFTTEQIIAAHIYVIGRLDKTLKQKALLGDFQALGIFKGKLFDIKLINYMQRLMKNQKQKYFLYRNGWPEIKTIGGKLKIVNEDVVKIVQGRHKQGLAHQSEALVVD